MSLGNLFDFDFEPAPAPTPERPKLFLVPMTTTDADEIAAIRKRRDDAQANYAATLKTTGIDTTKLQASYLEELGILAKRLWELEDPRRQLAS